MNCPKCGAESRKVKETLYRIEFICRVCRNIFYENKPDPVKISTFYCFNHQGKADALIQALTPTFPQVPRTEHIDFVLTDSDVAGKVTALRGMKKRNAKAFFVYPHTAPPSMVNDHYPPWEGTTAQFVVNEYHAEVLRGYGYPKPLHGIGWHLCPIRPFSPTLANTNAHIQKVLKVLFAPIHPRNAPIDKKVNHEVFQRLYKHVQAGEITLTVRMVGAFADNGLTKQEGVIYTDGKMDQSKNQIDNADVVIGHQTFAWLAIARGVPTVMMAEDMPRHFRNNMTYLDVPSWDKVKRLFQYPYDILEADDTMALLNKAARSDVDIADWRMRMIGEPFDPGKFVEIVKGYL